MPDVPTTAANASAGSSAAAESAVVNAYTEAVDPNAEGESISEAEMQEINEAWDAYNPEQNKEKYAEISSQLAERGLLGTIILDGLGNEEAEARFNPQGGKYYNHYEVDAVNNGMAPPASWDAAPVAPQTPIAHNDRLLAAGLSQYFDAIENSKYPDKYDPNYDDDIAGIEDIKEWEMYFDPAMAQMFGQVAVESGGPSYFEDLSAKILNPECEVTLEDFKIVKSQDELAMASAAENPESPVETLSPQQRQFVDWVLYWGHDKGSMEGNPDNINPWLHEIAASHGATFEEGGQLVQSQWARAGEDYPLDQDDLSTVLSLADKIDIPKNARGIPVIPASQWQAWLNDPTLSDEERIAVANVNAHGGRFQDNQGNSEDGLLDPTKANIDLNKLAFAYEGVDYASHRANSADVASEIVATAVDQLTIAIDSNDQESTLNIIATLNEGERAELEEHFQAQHSATIPEYVYSKQNDAVYAATIDAELKREGTDLDVAGTLKVGLTALKEDKAGQKDADNGEVEQTIRVALSSLDPKALQAVNEKYLADYGVSLVDDLDANAELFSGTTNEVVGAYLRQLDDEENVAAGESENIHVTVAKIGLADGNLTVFAEGMRLAPDDVRAKFEADENVREQIKSTFPDGGDQEIANDYLEYGTLSIATLATHDRNDLEKAGLLGFGMVGRTDEDDITRAAKNATNEEKMKFVQGEQLAKQEDERKKNNAEPASLTTEESEALTFYNSVHQALDAAAGGDKNKLMRWEAPLKGDPEVVTNMLNAYNYGYFGLFGAGGIMSGTDVDRVYSAVENLSEEDWIAIRQKYAASVSNGETFAVPEIEQAMDVLSLKPEDRQSIRAMLDEKLKAETYDKANEVGRRGLETVLSGNPTPEAAINALIYMTANEKQAYRTDPEFKSLVHDRLNITLGDLADGNPAQRTMANRILSRVGETEADEQPALALEGQEQLIDQVLLDSIRNAPASQTIADTEKLLSEYPALRNDLLNASQEATENPEFEAEGLNQVGSEQTTQSLNIALHRAVNQAINDKLVLPGSNTARINHESANLDFYGLEEWTSPIFENAHLPIDQKLMLANSEMERLQMLAQVSPEEREQLLSDDPAFAELHESVFSEGEPKSVELNIIENGRFDSVDQIRSFVVNSDFTQDDLMRTLDNLSPEEKTQVADEYFVRYGGLIVDDVLSKVTGAETVKVEAALQGVQLSPVMTAMRALEEAHGHNSAVDGAVMRVWDWTKQGMDASALQLFPTAVALQNASGENRKELEAQFAADIENFIEATNNHVESQNEAKEQAFNISIMVIAAAASVATGGTSLAVPAKLGLDIGLTAGVGAAYKNFVAATFEGNDYDLSEFDDNAVSGAVVAVLNRVDILKILAEPEGAAIFATAVRNEAKAAAISQETVAVRAAAKARSEASAAIIQAAPVPVSVPTTSTAPASITPAETWMGRGGNWGRTAPEGSEVSIGARNIDEVAVSNVDEATVSSLDETAVRDVDEAAVADDPYVRTSFTPESPVADDFAPDEVLIKPDHSYDDIEARRAANSADEIVVVADDVAPTEKPALNPDHRYDDIEARRAESSTDEIVVADDVAPTEEPVLNPDHTYDDIEAARAASSSTRSTVMESTPAESAVTDAVNGLRIRYPWGKYALRAATTKGSSRAITPTALVTSENLASREEANKSSEDSDVVVDQEESPSETSEAIEQNDKKFFTGEEVNINGRIAHRLEDGSYAFVIPEGDTLFVIRNDIATAMGEAAVEPGDAVYTDEMILALKAANEIGDPDLIYTGNQFVIPVEVINASQ